MIQGQQGGAPVGLLAYALQRRAALEVKALSRETKMGRIDKAAERGESHFGAPSEDTPRRHVQELVEGVEPCEPRFLR